MRSRLFSVGLAGLLLAAAACSSGSGDSGDDSSDVEQNDVDSETSIMRGWSDVCEVFDPDAVSEQLHIADYDEPPVHLGANEGNFPGALKCNFSFNFPEYPDTEDAGDLNGHVYMALVPHNTAEEAASGYQTSYDSAADFLHEQSEDEQVVEREIDGDWDSGAIFANVGTETLTTAMYLKDSYLVLIEIGHKPDPGVSRALSRKDMETFGNPTYEFTPPELADWFETEYFPDLSETISSKLEE